jgi:hypothetical protein
MAGNEFQVGQLAQELVSGYMAYAAIGELISHPGVANILSELEATNIGPAPVPLGRIFRGDGSEIAYHFTHFIRNVAQTADYKATYDRLWCAGSLLALGDALTVNRYFDRGPDLEFVRHLRNGVAHGNRFHFEKGEPSRPAHFTGPGGRLLADGTTTPRDSTRYFDITRSLQGREVLFDFIGPGDFVDLLQFVSVRLIRMGNGDPPLPLYPQRPY